MVDRYYRKIEDVENNIENAMQISSILLKLKEYDDDLGKIDTNENNISSNLGRISTNEGNISSNSSKLNNMDIDVKKDIYKKIFNINNFETTSNYKLIFETHIDFKFTKTGVIKIKANYEYLQLNNSRHTHVYLFKNNNTSFNEKHINHYSNIVNDEFSIPAVECENVDLIIFLVNPFSNNSKIILNKNNIEFIYNDFTKIPKTDYNLEKITTNEGNISSNTGSISTNEGNISSNLEKINDNSSSISSNLEKINDLQNSNIKAFYNLDQIFIYDIEKGDQTVNKDNHFHIFEKEIYYNFVKNSYLEIILKVLTEISNYVLIGFFQILCNFYDQDNNLVYTISLSTAMGSINKLSTIKSVFIVPINENMSKIKIDFFIAPKPTQQNRSAKFIIKDINSNKIYIKYYQKTDEMSIKNIQDSLSKLYLKNLFNTLYHDNDIKVSHIFFDKTYTLNAKKNDFLEIYFKLLLKYDNISEAKYVTTNFILYDMSNGRELYSASYNNSDYIGLANINVLLNNAFYFNFDNDIEKLKIAITFSWTRTGLNITYSSINTNRLIIKHYGN